MATNEIVAAHSEAVHAEAADDRSAHVGPAPAKGNDSVSRQESEESLYEQYVCHCCKQKCNAEEKDYLSDGEEEPPILYSAPSGMRDSEDSDTFKIAQPKCQCANCPLKNMCKCRQHRCVGQTLSKCFRYANF